MEDYIEDILNFALDRNTLEQISKALETNSQIIAIDSDVAEFRLFKPDSDTVNLEFMVQCKFGTSFEVVAQYKTNEVNLHYRYFKIYESNLTEFQVNNFDVQSFSMIESALMSAFGIESLLKVDLMSETKEKIKGIELEYFLSGGGEINIFANSKYGLNPSSALAVGVKRGSQIGINPAILYTDDYQRLNSLGLLAIGKFLR